MKKTLKQQNEELAKYIKQLDGQLNDSLKSDRNGNIIIAGFAVIIAGLLIFAMIQSRQISEFEQHMSYYESKIKELRSTITMHYSCADLAEVSGKSFYMSYGSCRLDGDKQMRLDTDQQILDAIRHYQLGSKK